MTLFGLFIITRCLDRTGVTRWIARRILGLGGRSEARLIALFAAATAFLSLFMNNLAAGALILTIAVSAMAEVGRPLRFVNVAFGLWLVAAPWVLGGASATASKTAKIVARTLVGQPAPVRNWSPGTLPDAVR